MNRETCGFSLSFFMHAFILGTLFYVLPALDLQPKPLVIDFSLISESGSKLGAALPKKEQPVKQPPVLQAPPKPRQLALPKPIQKVLPKEPPKPVIAKKVITRPVAKILPKKEEKVTQEEVLPETAEISRPAEPITASPVVQSQVAAVMTNSAVQASSSAEETAAAVSSEAMEQQYVKAHFIYIKKIIEKNISYPSMARRMGWQGKVVVSFVVCRDGKVENLQVVESSGHAPLDKNALETVRQVGPFPGPPVRVRLVLPVMYKIT